MFEKFTERAIKAVMLSQQEAKALSRPEVGAEHILMGLVAEEAKKGGYLGSGVTIEAAREKSAQLADDESAEARRARANRRGTSEVPFSRSAKRVFEAALQESVNQGMNYIAPEHIAVACAELDDDRLRQLFASLGCDRETMIKEARRRLKGERERDAGSRASQAPRAAGPNSAALQRQQQQRQAAQAGQKEKEEKSPLADFCVDLTAKARRDDVDPVIGREEEVERTIQILARRSKNNPILLGEPGVGKTAIAEGLSARIVAGDVPEFLREKRVLALDVGLLMAGAKERGELESRVTGLIAEIREKRDVVLMIDEVHTLIGAGAVGKGGGGGGGMDISNLLKPPLARGELQCIGATTVDEHRKYIEKDAALERRFQPVMVEEPSEEDAVEILFGLRDRYEKHHRCRITDDALVAAVHISARYIADRYLPDKAIDLIDEAGSAARIEAYMRDKEAALAAGERMDAASMQQMEQWRELKQVTKAKADAVADDLYEEASLLRQRELEVRAALVQGAAEGSVVGPGASSDLDLDLSGSVVDVAEIERIASSWSGIPVQRMTADEASVLADMDTSLRSCVIGQGEAVDAVARALRRTRCGLKDPNRPIASMLFAGPTGVGKTELTKCLAEKYFGSSDNMVRLDMSEYMERHSVSKLVGAPPGYVGFGQGGTLTEAVRRRPFTILLFDEIEKAHPDVFNILLQMMEDGRVTDSTGRVVSFKNTLIILTSNVGSKMITKGGQTLGFDLEVDVPGEDSAAYKRMRDKVLDELKNFFRPEMLNRLDEIVCFRQLEEESVETIARLMLAETAQRMRAKGMDMALTRAAMAKLLKVGFDAEYGARPLRRAITSVVDDTLSEALLKEEIKEGDVAVIDYDDRNERNEAESNSYEGVVVVARKPGEEKDACSWSSVGMDLDGEDEAIFAANGQKGPSGNNVVPRKAAPVNDDVIA